MKRLFLLLSLSISASLFAEDATRYLVSTRTPARSTRLRIATDAEQAARRSVRTFNHINGFAATLTAAEVEELRASGEVLAIEPVLPRYAQSVAAPKLGTQGRAYQQQVTPWVIDAANIRPLWQFTRGGGVNVAVLDTGIDVDHPEVKHAIAGQYNVYTKENNADDDNFHGTHVAGTIVAADNQVGIVGVAPDVRLWAVKVLDKNGEGTTEGVVHGLDWVIGKQSELGGRWVVNFSLGAPRPSDVERSAIQRALDANIIIIAGAGNRSFHQVDFPAGYQGVIAVGAIDQDDQVAGFSSRGGGLTIVAPGVDVPSSVPIGSHPVADVDAGSDSFRAYALTGSPRGTITGPMVYCGFGRPEEFPANMQGRIALISRGQGVPFREKARNAKNAGASAVVIFNHAEGIDDVGAWTLIATICDEKTCWTDPEWEGFEFPVTLGVDKEDGQKLLQRQFRETTVSFRGEDYRLLSGTSMASPVVAGTVAMLLVLDPNLTQDHLYIGLIVTSRDLGAKGWDVHYGYGAFDAGELARYVKPNAFGLDAYPNPYVVPKRRSSGRR